MLGGIFYIRRVMGVERGGQIFQITLYKRLKSTIFVGGTEVSMKTRGILIAGGREGQLAPEVHTAFLTLGTQAVVGHSLLKMEECREIDEIIIITDKGLTGRMLHTVKMLGCSKVRHIAAGGVSLLSAYETARRFFPEREEGVVLLHEAARPAVRTILMTETVKAARRHGVAAAACRISDAVHETATGMKSVRALGAGKAWMIQTPQAFRITVLDKVLQTARKRKIRNFSDLATLAANCGETVRLVESDFGNLKIRTPNDLPMLLTAMRSASG